VDEIFTIYRSFSMVKIIEFLKLGLDINELNKILIKISLYIYCTFYLILYFKLTILAKKKDLLLMIF